MSRLAHFIVMRRGMTTTVITAVLCLFLAACSTSRNTTESHNHSEYDSCHAAYRLNGTDRQQVVVTDTATALSSLYDRDSTAIRRQGDTVRVIEHWHTVIDRRTSSLNRHSRDTSSVASASSAVRSSSDASVAATHSRTVSSRSFLSSFRSRVVVVVVVLGVVLWLWILLRE